MPVLLQDHNEIEVIDFYRDLVEELNSKTFGNRWVAAYELSKYLASSRIPAQDIECVAENLIQVYNQSEDARTRNFIVLALGTLKHHAIFPTLNKAVDDPDSQVRFNAVVSLGNLAAEVEIDWQKLEALLNSTDDVGLKQAIFKHDPPPLHQLCLRQRGVSQGSYNGPAYQENQFGKKMTHRNQGCL